jgi:hypothetical protein
MSESRSDVDRDPEISSLLITEFILLLMNEFPK